MNNIKRYIFFDVLADVQIRYNLEIKDNKGELKYSQSWDSENEAFNYMRIKLPYLCEKCNEHFSADIRTYIEADNERVVLKHIKYQIFY